MSAKTSADTPAEIEAVNTVVLRGRLAAAPLAKELPSGDVLVVFRLTVARPPGERVKVDSIECVATRARPRRALERAEPGDDVEVSGSLRRRFWRSPAGPASRYAVDVTAVKVRPVRSAGRRAGRQAGPRGGASAGRTPASA